MIINVLAQRKLMGAIAEFVRKELGNKYTVSPPYDLLGVFNDSYNTSPIIFVLTPGADPISDLITLAKAKGMEARFKYISLGQG
jgi:dynein heavy chain